MQPRFVEVSDRGEWLRMRAGLWPGTPEEHEREVEEFFAQADPATRTWVVERELGRLGAFLELRLRPCAEGCESSPVAYVEGWWVDPDLRRQGVGAALLGAAEEWAREQGIAEMASDAEWDNTGSQAAHRALGFTDVGKVVCYRKSLTG